MPAITLHEPTGDPSADAVVCAVVGIFETTFPGRVRSYYLEGSFADASAVATSDIDLVVVFRESWRSSAERDQAKALAGYCASLSKLELDIVLEDDQSIAHGVYPSLRLGSRLLFGEDTREGMRLMPIEAWRRERMHAAYWLTINVFKRPQPVRLPISYPDPSDEFRGYTQRLLHLPDGRQVPCTRDLIRVTGWAATALIALKARRYVARKRDCYRVYGEQIADEWTPLLVDIYVWCRNTWNYLIPEIPEDRLRLRQICERTLLFENYFMNIHKSFILDELRSADAQAQNAALGVLQHTTYQDREIEAAVRLLATS